MLKSLLYIFSFLILGEFIKYIFNIPIAGNIVGMLLIFCALKFRLIKIEDVKSASDKLMKYLILFFIPYGVGLMVYYDVVKVHFGGISIAVISSTVITLFITAIIMQKFGKNG